MKWMEMQNTLDLWIARGKPRVKLDRWVQDEAA